MTSLHEPSSEEALRYCRNVTRQRARNFYYGLKLLPEPQRSALYAVYAWMRRADDLADRNGEDNEVARQRIEALRSATLAAFDGRVQNDDPVLVSLRETAQRFALRADYFLAMLDGQIDDLEVRSYETFADLREYCYQVASTVGLICITVWGCENNRAPTLAIDRGIAFQLTNILRDYAEDFDAGRVYLPREEFEQAGLEPAVLRRWSDPERCRQFVLEQVERAERYYAQSQPLESMVESSCLPTLWAMTRIYHGLLEKIRSDPARVALGPRIRLSAVQKGAIALSAKWRARGTRVASS